MSGQAHIVSLTKAYAPAAVAGAETAILFKVRKGDRILAAAFRRLVNAAAATNTTIGLQISVAAGGGALGLIGAMDTETGAVNDVVDGVGADLVASGGFLCTGDGTIDAIYATPGAPGAVNPSVRVNVLVLRNRGNL